MDVKKTNTFYWQDLTCWRVILKMSRWVSVSWDTFTWSSGSFILQAAVTVLLKSCYEEPPWLCLYLSCDSDDCKCVLLRTHFKIKRLTSNAAIFMVHQKQPVPVFLKTLFNCKVSSHRVRFRNRVRVSNPTLNIGPQRYHGFLNVNPSHSSFQ